MVLNCSAFRRTKAYSGIDDRILKEDIQENRFIDFRFGSRKEGSGLLEQAPSLQPGGRCSVIRTMIQNVAIVLLFCIGAALMLQPWWYHFVQEKRQQALLEQWNERTAAGEKAGHKTELRTEHRAGHEVRNEAGTEAGPPAPQIPVTAGEEVHVQEAPESPLSIDGYAIQAMLSIEKLKLLEPVVQGADPEALRTGIGIVEPDRLPGTIGNYVLAGHRSWTYGKQFSRLNELEKGDRVVIKTPVNAFEYEVTSKYLVEPDDLSVLDQSKNKAEMTLITCEPKYNPTHRLIVKAVWRGPAGSVS